MLILILSFISCQEGQVPPEAKAPSSGYVPPKVTSTDDEKNEGNKSPDFDKDESKWAREASKLTKDFTNFPSSQTMNEYLNTALSSPTSPCPNIGLYLDEYPIGGNQPYRINPAAKGARRLLASFYQSCKAIDITIDRSTPNLQGISKAKTFNGQVGISGGYLRKLTNTQAMVSSHNVLSVLDQDPEYPGPQCSDATKRPPIYGYGSRAFPNDSGEVKIFKKGGGVARTSNDVSGIDCSAFIATALGSQGLKVATDAGPFTANTTRSFHSQLSRSNSCLKKANVTPNDAIRAGDMINVAGSHIIMIDQVGEDPLAIDKYAELGSCNSINPAEFDFTYIHSGSIKSSYGPSRVKANTHRSGTMWNNLRLIAVEMCLKKVQNNNDRIASGSLAGVSSRFSLIRHQSDNPSCVSDKRIKIEGEDCINSCENINKDV